MRKVKLSSSERFELPDLGRVVAGVPVRVTDREAQRLSTVYWDSDDLRLARLGLSLRYDAGQGWTLKLPIDTKGGLLVRDELTFEGSRRQPPAEAVDLVAAYLRGAPMRSRAHLRTLRRGVLLYDAEGRLLADVVDDAVSVLDGQRVVARFRELEVEATPEMPRRALKALLVRLRGAGAEAPDPTPRYLRAIGASELAPPEVIGRSRSNSASLGDIVAGALGDSLLRLLRHDPVVRLDIDPEGVHQARVATRRLRSDLRTFRAALDPRWAAELRGELGWLGGELGAARDADVLLARLTARARSLPDASAESAAQVIGALEQRRTEAHHTLLETLRDGRYLKLLDRLIEAAQAPNLLQEEAERPATEALPPVVRKAWRALARKVRALADEPADEELHRVRILAKRCRYAAEACVPPLGKPARKPARAARELQDALGELQDAVVAEQWLRDWAAGTHSGPGAFAAGELAALERAAARHARAQWPKWAERYVCRA